MIFALIFVLTAGPTRPPLGITKTSINNGITIFTKILNDEFPGITINSNKLGPPVIRIFVVYIKYVGSKDLLDKFGRLKLYKRKNRRPYSREILDSVHLLSYIFEDAQEISRIQNEVRRIHGEFEKHEECLTGPASINVDIRPTRRAVTEFDTDTMMVCKNWGCLVKTYMSSKNHKKACLFHPGRWEFGSIHGLWPENWTCCRGSWDSKGCTYSFRRGVPASKL